MRVERRIINRSNVIPALLGIITGRPTDRRCHKEAILSKGWMTDGLEWTALRVSQMLPIQKRNSSSDLGG